MISVHLLWYEGVCSKHSIFHEVRLPWQELRSPLVLEGVSHDEINNFILFYYVTVCSKVFTSFFNAVKQGSPAFSCTGQLK